MSLKYFYDYFSYNTEWYTVLDKTTKLVSFMMLRSTKPCVQTAGRVFPMTLMNFTVVSIDDITNIIAPVNACMN